MDYKFKQERKNNLNVLTKIENMSTKKKKRSMFPKSV